jgi:ABC-2 type transport system permease protein
MKFREIFRFELAYQLRRLPTWIYFTTMFAFGFLMVRAVGGTDEYLNAPFFILLVTVGSGAIWLFMAASVAGEAGARDVQTLMYSLTYTAPVSKNDYLGGRFLAAFVLNALLLLAVQLGFLLSLYLPGVNPEFIGPFSLTPNVAAYFIIALPNAFVITAIQFASSTLGRRVISSHLASIAIFIASHGVLGMIGSLLGHWEWIRTTDLVGLVGIVGYLDNALSDAEKNTRLIIVEWPVLANRLFWIGAAAVILAFTYHRFTFSEAADRSRRRLGRRRPVHAPTPAGHAIARTSLTVPVVPGTFGFATYLRQMLGIACDSFRRIAKNKVGLTFIVLLAIPMILFAPEALSFRGVPAIATTLRVLSVLVAPLTNLQHPLIIVPLLIAYYAGELIWRERDNGLSEIADASPAPEWTLFLGKFVGLALVIVAWQALVMVAGMLIQLRQGYHHVEIGLYLKILLGLQLVDYLLFALLAFVVHVVVNQKYLAHLVVLIVFGLMAFPGWFGIHHNLLIYASDPGWHYTDMRGFADSVAPWLWFKLYWVAWAALFAVAARLLLVRGKERSLEVRLRMARARLTRPTVGVAAAAIGLILAVGGFVFYNTNVLNAYETPSDRTRRRAEYEKRYGRYGGIPQPRVIATNLRVEIYPEQREVQINGTYKLLNRGEVAIDSIHLAASAETETRSVRFDRQALPVIEDKELGHRIYALAQPLQPGDSVQLSFEVHYQPRGFRNRGETTLLAANGTFFTSEDLLPAIGYQRNRELNDAGPRRTHGLSRRSLFPSLDDVGARQIGDRIERETFEAIVGTSENQVAVAPGLLKRTWTEGGRRYFHFATDVPIHEQYGIMSANYNLREAQWKDVAIRIYYHPRHAASMDRIVRGVEKSLAYFTGQFGPYPSRQLTIVEQPSRGWGAHAEPTMIWYRGDFPLLSPRADRGFDLPAVVMAHEVGHQWWGHQLVPAYVEGAGLLVEGLAVYSAIQFLRATDGDKPLLAYLHVLRQDYEVPRTRALPPVLRANDRFLYYRKGALSIYAMSEYVGADKVNGAVRRLFKEHTREGAPLATTLDLYRELQAVTPDSLRTLLHDLFEANIYWNLEMKAARADSLPSGEWRVTLEVLASKVEVDSAGAETPIPMDDLIEVGLWAPSGDGDWPRKPFYLQKYRIKSGKQTITVTVSQQPNLAGIDPRFLMVDLLPEDNIKEVAFKR